MLKNSLNRQNISGSDLMHFVKGLWKRQFREKKGGKLLNRLPKAIARIFILLNNFLAQCMASLEKKDLLITIMT